jgi:predicted RNA binding protein YcfA (HicA-like mRNA interferase family)
MRVLLDTHVLLWARAAAAGWYEVARRGNHVQLRHPSRKGCVTMPHPRTDLPAGSVRSIERRAGIRLLPRR